MPESITAAEIKRLSALNNNKKDRQSFVIEGLRLVNEIFKPNNLYPIEQVVFSADFSAQSLANEILEKLKLLNLPWQRVTNQAFRKMSALENPEGILAELKLRSFSADTILKRQAPVFLFGIEIQDPGNLGTLFRSAEAFGVGGIFLSTGTVDPYNSKVLRASMGSVLRLPWVKISDCTEKLQQMQKSGFEIIGAAARRGVDLASIKFNFPLVLVVGNEARGLPENMVDNISKFVNISMKDSVESLNVGVAASIMLYQINLQKMAGSNLAR